MINGLTRFDDVLDSTPGGVSPLVDSFANTSLIYLKTITIPDIMPSICFSTASSSSLASSSVDSDDFPAEVEVIV